MFVVRRSQIEALSRAATDDFVDRMLVHLAEVFPESAEDLGPAGLEARVREGILRAARWGMEREYEICLYLHVMLALGPHFDSDPEIPWARGLLEEPALGPAARIGAVHDRVFAAAAPPAPTDQHAH